MAQVITIPKLGLTMEKGLIAQWLVKLGDSVSRGETLYILETDKISTDVESPEDAYVIAILAEEGQECDVYAPVCVLGEKGEKYEMHETAGVALIQNTTTEIKETAVVFSIVEDSIIKISPVARKLAKENGLDIAKVAGTGPEGRITREDILAYIEKKTPRENSISGGSETISGKQPVSGIRKIIAQRMSESKRSIPHVYFKTSVDATYIVRKRTDSGKKYS